MKNKKSKVVSYNKWGYIFLIPFFVVFVVFQLWPLVMTIKNSFYEYYKTGMSWVGPNWVGIKNYVKVLGNPELWKYAGNTLIMWIAGFIPQIFFSLLLAAWFTDPSLRLKGQRFFKTVIYLPNLIMASAFAMLFFTLFAITGPVNSILTSLHIFKEPFEFMANVAWTRGLVAFMNFVMWFGNTTILLMAGMMSIDGSLFEAAEVDGATSNQVFFKITLPLLRPILVYVLVTSLIGGLQMFDVPQILTNKTGNPTRHAMTLIMYLSKHLYNFNYGIGGALSVFLFVITGILSIFVFRFAHADEVK